MNEREAAVAVALVAARAADALARVEGAAGVAGPAWSVALQTARAAVLALTHVPPPVGARGEDFEEDAALVVARKHGLPLGGSGLRWTERSGDRHDGEDWRAEGLVYAIVRPCEAGWTWEVASRVGTVERFVGSGEASTLPSAKAASELAAREAL